MITTKKCLHVKFLYTGELKEDSGLGVLAKQFEIDVDEVGVEGAKTFFEAKVINYLKLYKNLNCLIQSK